MAQYRRLSEDSEETALFAGPPSPPPEEVVRTSFVTSPSALPKQDFISGRDIWKQFEVHRRNAEYYLDHYLGQLDRISDASIAESDNIDSTQYIVPRGGQGVNRATIRLKISSDTAVRDILAMESIAQFVAALPQPTETHVVSTLAGVWTVGCSVSALVVQSMLLFGISAGGAVTGGVL